MTIPSNVTISEKSGLEMLLNSTSCEVENLIFNIYGKVRSVDVDKFLHQ